jgi:hypothetical protein
MTPGQAAAFAEDDQDPRVITARYDTLRALAAMRCYMVTRYGTAAPLNGPGWYQRGGQIGETGG